MKTSIIGCEHFNDYQVLKWRLDEVQLTQIITCGNKEIDKMAARYAKENGIKLISLWTGKQEGKISIRRAYYNSIQSSDLLHVFWFGENKIVLEVINKAKKLEKEVVEIRGYHKDTTKAVDHTPLLQSQPLKDGIATSKQQLHRRDFAQN